MSEQIVDLRSVWAALRRSTRVLTAGALVGALAGAGAVWVLPPQYRSTGIVLFPATSTASSPAADAHPIDTQIQIALSDSVLSQAGASVRPRLTAVDVADRIQVEAPTADVLTITAIGGSPVEAQALAEAVAKADVAFLRDSSADLTKDQRSSLSRRKETLAATLEDVQTQLQRTTDRLRSETPSSSEGRADAAAVAQLTARQADLVLQVDALERQAAAGQASVGSAAAGPRVLQPFSPAVTTPQIARGVVYVGGGTLLGLLALAAVAVLAGRRETTLRSRDQIADSIGVPVVASVQTRTPRSVAGWAALFEDYAPDSVEAWTLRQLLQRLTPGTHDSLAGPRHGARRGSRTLGEVEDAKRPTRVVVLTLSGDQPALSLGPQLASFSAGAGAATALVVLSQQDEASSSLRVACSRIERDAQPRPGLFVDTRPDVRHDGDVLVHVLDVDRHRPDPYLPGVDDAVTLLAVSSGAATAQDLARVALAADEANRPLDGIVVCNPDPLDRTTGRLLPQERAVLTPLPSLMTGAAPSGEPSLPSSRRRHR